MSWKVPAILYYARRNLNAKYNLVIKNPIEASVLLAEASLARKQRKCHATFIPLMLSEMPQAGDLVGLDAEFVTLNEVGSLPGAGNGAGAAPWGAPGPTGTAGAAGL